MLKIKLLPSQVVTFWETIKYVTVLTDEVDAKDRGPYFNELLQALLCEKAQCFVALDDDRKLQWMVITRITDNRVTGQRYMYLQSLYSFMASKSDAWKKDLWFIGDFARAEKCQYISFNSRVGRIWEMGEMFGFKEKYRVYEMRLEA